MRKKPIKILIVDDNKDLASTISDHYASHELGIISLNTSEPAEVLPILSKNPDISVILSDFYMPGMNGLELLLSVREKYPNMLFILMTGYHTSEIQELGLEHGAIRFFNKPFSMDELTDLIQETMAETISGFDGTIESIQLPDIIQLIGLGHRSVELRLTVDDAEGSMFFDNGEIIHAEYKSIKGEEAFHEMFNWRGGQFTVKSATTTVEKTIDQSWQGLLLEAARRQDEARAIAEGAISDSETEALETEMDVSEPDTGRDEEPVQETAEIDEVHDLDESIENTTTDIPSTDESTDGVTAEIEEITDEISQTKSLDSDAEAEPGEEVPEPSHVESKEPETAEPEHPDETLTAFMDSDTDRITETRTEGVEQKVLDERFISEALEAAVEHYIRYWSPDDEKLITSSLPMHTLPENIRNHFQFRFQQYLMRVIQSDNVPFDFNNEKVTSTLQQLLDALYSTWEVPREKYLEILRYAISFELAHSIDPARAITEVIHEISGGITSEIKLLVQNMVDYKLIGEHYLSLVVSISGQKEEEISARSIEYICRSVILRLDEQERYELVREAMRCILDIANIGSDEELEFLDYNVVLNMLETHGLAQVSDYINMTRELGQVFMSIADLDNAMEKFKQRSAGMAYE